MPDNITPVADPGDYGPWKPPIKDFDGVMETIVIPETGMYPIEITINGLKRTLYARPGDEVEVPVSVAKVLKNVKRPAPAEDGWKDAWATLRDCGESGGGSKPTYETVAEIPVGTMEKAGEAYSIEMTLDAPIGIESGETSLFFNSSDAPLSPITVENTDYAYAYNYTIGGGATGVPYYALMGKDLEGESMFSIISSEDLSNTTVRILKKVEQGGGDSGAGGDFLITATLDETKTPEEGTLGFFTLDKTAAEIEAAYTANRPMRVKMAQTENGMTDIFYFNLVGAAYSYGTTTPDLIFIGTMAQNPPTVHTLPCYISFGEKEGESLECVIYAPQTGS